MGWLTYRITGSAWLLGVVAFCANIGILVLGPFAGVLADRVNRRRRALCHAIADARAGAGAGGPGGARPRRDLAPDRFALWLGIVSAFDVPLRQSLYVHLVEDRADLPNAIALNSFSSTRRASWGRRSPGCCCRSPARRSASH